MRSKLDEIVDENCPHPHAGTCSCSRIAERAFRHGVERAEKAGDFSSSGVQPAEVEAKACTNCGHTPHGTDQCKQCTSRSILPYCVDRRKGQRRMGLEWVRGDQYLYLGEDLVAAKSNHRSGSDRRKS